MSVLINKIFRHLKFEMALAISALTLSSLNLQAANCCRNSRLLVDEDDWK